MSGPEFREGDKVLFMIDDDVWEAVVTSEFLPDEEHNAWTYGIDITDEAYQSPPQRPRDAWWAWGHQLNLIED